jgi:7-cyano-7-deazaguanine synthase
MKEDVLLSLSGGLDSTTLLALLLDHSFQVHCVTFYYGSKHNQWENQAAADVFKYYKKKGVAIGSGLHFIDLSNIMKMNPSNLLLSGGAVPEGYYTDDSMKATVVPGRNLLFASVLASMAESMCIPKIALGVHSGDHHIYPDCRTEFIKALDTTIYLSTDKQVEVIAPLSNMNKAEIVKQGYSLSIPVPYQLTRTCYKKQQLACGKCGSCRERIEAFALNKKKDPIQYERHNQETN